MTKNTKHAVVTGGAGFVGSHLVDRLRSDEFRVTVLDNYGSGRRANLAHRSDDPLVTAVEHDVREPLPDFDRVDHVYHFASRASPADFERYPVEIAETNSIGARRVFDLTKQHAARAIIASTSEVYGDPEVHPQTEEYWGNVNPRGPRAPYDESKRFAEALAIGYERQHGLDVRAVRIFNCYGPRMRTDDGRAIPNFLSQALCGEDLTVYGDGTQTRSFCYVDDLVDGVRRIGDAQPEVAAGEVFNVGSTHEITINTLAQTVLRVVDSPSGIVHLDRPMDEPEIRQPDISKIRSALGWEPKIELEDGLRRTIDYFQQELDDTTADVA